MKNYLKSNLKTRVILFLIILVAGSFRLYGLNWDQNQHLHPDERFLTMVTGDMKWPNTLKEYLNPNISPLNPYNAGYGFFVYGTFPLTIVKSASNLFTIDKFDYNNITLVGRIISAIFDLGVVILVFNIAKKIFDEKVGLLASFLYAISVLPIQLAHFYTVDTFLGFFIVLSFYFLVSLVASRQNKTSKQVSRNDLKGFLYSIGMGAALGLALASKISSALFLPVIGIGILYYLSIRKSLIIFTVYSLAVLFSTYFFLRIGDPRVFASANFFDIRPNPIFLSNLKDLRGLSDPKSIFPPSVQWIETKPIIFPLKNMVLWGLGLPLGILIVGGVSYSIYLVLREGKKMIKSRLKSLNNLSIENFGLLIIASWTLFLLIYQGVQFVKAMRYFYLIYPFLTILAAYLMQKALLEKVKSKFLQPGLIFILLVYPLSFSAIYTRPHSRVTASKWIYENIPPGSTISCEHWDDCLPLGIGRKTSNLYQIETLTLYDPDSKEKWQKINDQLSRIDYVIMSSNRLWGFVPKVPERYPVTSQFYSDLFNEKLNFTKVAEITSYPTVPILNIPIPDDSADESFTVYDHPKVLIYKNKL